MNVLALEASTSAAKAVVFSAELRALAEVSVPFEKNVGDIVTLDAEGVYEALVSAGKEAVRKAGVPVHGCGLSTIWHSLLAVDGQKRPLGRALTWANTDASGTAAPARRDGALCAWLYGRTGCMVHAFYPLWQWKYLKENKPESLFGIAGLWSLATYLGYRLTGKARATRCFAAGSGLFNIHTLDWDGEVLAFAGIDPALLPELCEPDDAFAMLPEAAAALGIKSVPVALGGGDGALNQVGSGAMGQGIMTFSVGTSGALRLAADGPLLPDQPSTWCYYIAEGKRIAGAATSGACNCVDWLRKTVLGGRWDFPDLESAMLAAKPQWADAPVFLPFLYGERCPGWSDRRSGGYVALRGSHEVGHLYYALLEGVLMNLYQCYLVLEGMAGVPREIRLSGGIVRAMPWQQMAADLFGRPLVVTALENQSIFGAAALGFKAAGALARLEDWPFAPGYTVAPDPAMRAHYQGRFERYCAAYAANAPAL